MANAEDVHDDRGTFWREHFQRADNYETYLAGAESGRARQWRDLAEKLPALTPEQAARLQGYGRQLNVLVYSGVWCGDCVRQGPMIEAIAAACGTNVTLRVIDRDASEALTDELRILGGARVPVVVFLSEDFFEVGRFGDRLLSAYRAKGRSLDGTACTTGLIPPPDDELAAEMNDWLDVFERMLLMVRLSPFLRARHGD